jgi:hypothetical protein
MTDLMPQWRKSTRSSGNQGACVEVADNLPGRVLVRDTKDRGRRHAELRAGGLAGGSSTWRSGSARSADHPHTTDEAPGVPAGGSFSSPARRTRPTCIDLDDLLSFQAQQVVKI